MEIKNFKWVNKLPVICSFDLDFAQMGFSVREFKLMETQGKKWISMPCRSYKDSEGKTKYFNFILIAEAKKAAFEKKVLALLEPFMKQQPVSAPPQSTFVPDETVPF